jgi:hypothetical protein
LAQTIALRLPAAAIERTWEARADEVIGVTAPGKAGAIQPVEVRPK